MKPLLFFIIISFFFLNQACQHQVSKSPADQAIKTSTQALPKLLKRNPGVGTDEEQVMAQTRYSSITQAITQNPQDAKSHLQLAELFMWEARITGEHGHYYPAALEVIETVLKGDQAPDKQFQALSYKASVLLSLHQFDEARKVAEVARAINPHNAQIHGALVDAHVELGNYEEAVNMADKMVSIRPDLRSYSRVSYLREIHGDIPGSIEAMDMAVTAGLPGTEEAAWARLTLGNLYAKNKQPEKAEMHFRQILAERPSYPFATAALADLAYNQEEYKKAETLLNQAIELIPEVGFYHQLALLYQKTGRVKERDQLVSEMLLMLKDDEESGHKMGLAYAELYLDLTNDFESALKYATEEYDARPKNIDVNAMMARVYEAMEKPEKAAKHRAVTRV